MADFGIRMPGSTVRAPAFRYHGAKFRLAPWVISHFPPHQVYVEAFGGAAGVMLQKPRAYAEVYNDLDGDVVNFFRVIRDPSMRPQLLDAIEATPYSRVEFEGAFEPSEDPVERARRLLVRAQMGFGSAGATKGVTGFRIDTKRAYSTAQGLWARYPAVLADVGVRFTGVLIENRPAIEVMRQHDAPTTLHYVDPPYVHATRVMQASGAGYYRHEMSEADHAELLSSLLDLEGMVLVSGYATSLYDDTLKGWSRYETRARIAAGRGAAVRTEVLWASPACGTPPQALLRLMEVAHG